MLILTAPGQGAQAPGFLSPWLDIPSVAEQIGPGPSWPDAIWPGSARRAGPTTSDTAVAQPLLVAAALAVAALLPGPDATAGHSVGGAAGTIAGILDPADAIRLTAVRGNAMRQSCNATPTGMTVVLGGDEAAVLAAIEAAGATPANVNGAGQVVAGGTMEQLAALVASPPAGTRLRGLKVASAFHTAHMAPAVAALGAAAARTVVRDPAIPVLSNRDGGVVAFGAAWLERIVTQVAAPVRWDLCMRTMSDIGVTALVELVPGGTLTGLAKRALPGVELLAVNTLTS